MNRILYRCRVVGVLAAAALCAQSAAAQGQKAQTMHYTVTDLGMASGSTPAGPLAITGNRLIADAVPVSDAWHAALWFLGMQIDLARTGGLGGPNSAALGVNERGQAVGEAETNDPDPKGEDFCRFDTLRVCQAFIWRNGVMSAWPPLKGANGVAGRNAVAQAINVVGQVAGVAENGTIDSTCPPYSSNPLLLQFQTYQFEPVIWTDGEIQ